MCCLQEKSSLVCRKPAEHVVVDSSMQMGRGCHTSAISTAILTTLTRLVSSSDTPCTPLAASLLLPNSLALSSFEYVLEADP